MAYLAIFCLLLEFLSVTSSVKADDSTQGCLPSTYKLFNNNVFIGNGYNPYKGNPHAAYIDPGLEVPIFRLGNYSKRERTPDREYLMPNGIDVHEELSCKTDFTSEVISDASKLEKFFRAGVDLESDIVGAPFSANIDYHHIDKRTRTRRSVFVESTAVCIKYSAKLKFWDLPEVTTNFQNGVNSLPDEYNETSARVFMDFLRYFGTHVVSSVSMGARITVRHEISTSSFSKHLGHQLNIKAAASGVAAGGVVSGSAQASLSNEKNEEQEFTQSVQTRTVFAMGSSSPPDPENYAGYLTGELDELAPVKVKLTPISKYIRGRGEDFQKQVDKAISQFCHQVDGANCDKASELSQVPVLCQEPVFSRKWKSNLGCVWQGFYDDNTVSCDKGQVMAAFRVSRRMHFGGDGVHHAFHDAGCIRNVELLDAAPANWLGPLKKNFTSSIVCESNYVITAIQFSHQCWSLKPSDEYVSIRCQRSRYELGPSVMTSWEPHVNRQPSWSESACPLGYMMTGIEFKQVSNSLKTQNMRLRCSPMSTKCVPVLPATL